MKARELKHKWGKDIDKDFIRELQMDEGRLSLKEIAPNLYEALEGLKQLPQMGTPEHRDEIRLRDKEKK